ncbi:hypothetical protein C1T17_12510 [Sphingobium sp. SCG-1]|uniref:MFS transporter n=1 Tax=Sphingobium sp. SCG-1 TaxID=2072936 RepID=UPI000CD6B7A7|nr:MFS transporter [Sphingobium sp. SCG-1]AUW58794.1 hypothetical protein C1T17_12510 [Sphingobium sp. SCG-1]
MEGDQRKGDLNRKEAAPLGEDAPNPIQTSGVGPWGIVIIFMILYALAYFDKRLITLLIEPIRQTIHATDLEMSILSGTAFVSFYVIFSFPIGWAADRFSRRNIIFWGVVSWSAFATFGGFSRTFWHLLGSRFGVGAGEASLMPSAHSIIADIFPREKLSRALGVFTLGAFLGSALSFAIGGALLSHFAGQSRVSLPLIGDVLPWQAVLLLASAPGIPLAFLLFLFKEPMRSGRVAASHSEPNSSSNAFFRRHWRFFALHFSGFSILSVMTSGLASWLPTHMLRTFSEPIGHAGLILAALQLTVGPAGMLLTVRTVDRMFRAGRKDAHMTFYVVAALILSCAGILVGVAPNARVAYGGVMVFDMLHGGFLPVAGAVLQLATPAQYRGQATAIFFVCYNVVGQAFGPIAVALATDYLFASEGRIGASIALTCAVAGPLCAFLLYASRSSLRSVLAEAE